MIGPSMRADAADHHDEDRERAPVHGEGGVGRDAQVAEEIERAREPGAERRGDVDAELGARARRCPGSPTRPRCRGSPAAPGPGASAGTDTSPRSRPPPPPAHSQKVTCTRVAFSIPRSAVRLVPEPPPTADQLAIESRTTSAITQVPIAKVPPCKRKASPAIGTATAAVTIAASGTATEGIDAQRSCPAPASRSRRGRRNACCPIETMPP